PQAGFKDTAVAEAHALCRQCREFADGIFQAQFLLFTDILAQDARESPIGAGMRMFLAEQAVRGRALRVVVNGNPRLLESQRDIGLRHAKDSNVSVSVVLDEKIEDGVDRVFVPYLRDVSYGLALKRKKLLILHDTDQYRFRAGDLLPLVVPLSRRCLHLFADASTESGIFQALHQLGVAAVMSPRGHEG